MLNFYQHDVRIKFGFELRFKRQTNYDQINKYEVEV